LCPEGSFSPPRVARISASREALGFLECEPREGFAYRRRGQAPSHSIDGPARLCAKDVRRDAARPLDMAPEIARGSGNETGDF
jgi:hypothetical protein